MSPKPIKISIVTIVLNQEKYIQRAIDSVKNQTYSNIEYIIVDGASKDNTINIIKENEQHISKWISESDKGISDAFNKGLALCTGELIGMVNADDWLEEEAVANAVEQYDNGDILYGKIQYWKGTNKLYISDANHNYLCREMTINHPAVFVKKKLYDKYGYFNESYKCAMDYELMLRLFSSSVKFCYIDKVISNMQSEGISDINWRLGCKEVKRAKDNYLGKKIKHWLWMQKQITTIATFRFMEQIGFSGLIKFYRKKLAPIKKG